MVGLLPITANLIILIEISMKSTYFYFLKQKINLGLSTYLQRNKIYCEFI